MKKYRNPRGQLKIGVDEHDFGAVMVVIVR
jgi:hypothetical protein